MVWRLGRLLKEWRRLSVYNKLWLRSRERSEGSWSRAGTNVSLLEDSCMCCKDLIVKIYWTIDVNEQLFRLRTDNSTNLLTEAGKFFNYLFLLTSSSFKATSRPTLSGNLSMLFLLKSNLSKQPTPPISSGTLFKALFFASNTYSKIRPPISFGNSLSPLEDKYNYLSCLRFYMVVGSVSSKLHSRRRTIISIHWDS